MARAHLFGTPVSPGIAIGTIRFLHVDTAPEMRRILPSEVEAEKARLLEAMEAVREDLKTAMGKVPADMQEYREIIAAQVEMTRDPKLVNSTCQMVERELVGAAWALDNVVNQLVEVFRSIDDPYLKDRAQDVRVVGMRILNRLSGGSRTEASATDLILAAEDVSPADIMDLDVHSIRGIVTREGGITSHTAILARGMHIPALVCVTNLLVAARDGDTVIIDGLGGNVLISPNEEDTQDYSRREKAYAAWQEATRDTARWPADTKDALRVGVLANVEHAHEAAELSKVGADGIGLYRTEFAFLKEKLGTGYYEELIRRYLLENPHGAVVIVEPEQGRTARMDAALTEKLQEYKESLGREEQEELVRRTKELEAYQSAPEREEDLARIPVLKREDISREIEPVINEEMNLAGVPLVFHETQTNGIGYVDLMFDLSGVREDLLPYVGILQSVLGIIDTEHYSYGELFNEINRCTGGIGTSLELYNDVTRVREKAFRATFEVKGKALYDKLPVVFSMAGEILTASKLGDEKRLREILAMAKSRLLMRFQSSGHSTAALRALSYGSPSAKLKDLTNGIDFYRTVAGLEEKFEEKKEELIRILQELTRQLFRPDNLMISYTASREGLKGLEEMIRSLKESLFTDPVEEETCVLHCEKKNEGFKTASKVQYVARTGNFIDQGAEYTGALQILKVILSYDYLWQNIRVKGGAYGCMSSFNRIGEGYLVSYRDPHLKRTMDVYEGVTEYLKNFTVSERDMTKYIIGTMSNIDHPMTPCAKGERSMNLYMNKVSPEMIREERRQILEAGQEDIRALAKVTEALLAAGQICVIGSEEKIEEEKELFETVTSF